MKKVILFTLLISLVIQTQGQDIQISDGNSYSCLGKSKKWKKGSMVRFKINNVNIFKVNNTSMNIKSSSIDFGAPSFPQDIMDILKEKQDSITNSSSSNGKKLKSNPNIATDFGNLMLEEQFIEKYRAFVDTLLLFEQKTQLENRLWKLLGDSVFISNTTVLKCNADYIYRSLDGENLANLLPMLMNRLTVNYSNLKYLFNKINSYSVNKSYTINGQLQLSGDNKNIKLEEASISDTTPKRYAEEMDVAEKAVQQIIDTKKRQEIIEKADAGKYLYDKIKKTDFAVYTDPVQLNDDFVTITPAIKSNNGKTIHEFQPYTFNTYGSWKINFSAGYMLSFIGDDNYNVTRNDEGKITGVAKANSDKIKHALGGLGHVYYDFGTNILPALSFGSSLTEDTNLGFYAGLSLLATEKNRFVLTVGCSSVKVNKFDQTNLDGNNKFVSEIDTEIKYNNVYKFACFVAFSYNLSK